MCWRLYIYVRRIYTYSITRFTFIIISTNNDAGGPPKYLWRGPNQYETYSGGCIHYMRLLYRDHLSIFLKWPVAKRPDARERERVFSQFYTSVSSTTGFEANRVNRLNVIWTPFFRWQNLLQLFTGGWLKQTGTCSTVMYGFVGYR